MEEFEIKFLEVDVPQLEKKLLQIGAKKVAEYDYSRTLFDYPDLRMEKNNAWLKLRTDGKETTLSYKQRIGVKSHDGSIPDEGMTEIEVEISDYEKAFNLLKSIGMIVKRDAKNKRIRYKKNQTVFDIDFWPQIPPYVEIESDSLANAEASARELGFDRSLALMCSPENVYLKYGINLKEYSSVTFEKMIKKNSI